MEQKLRVVLIGGPASGKTTLIEQFDPNTYTIHSEISREVTKKAQERGIDQLFLEDPFAFSQELLNGRIQQFKDASTGLNIYDRGIPDVPAYHVFTGDDIPQQFIEASRSFRYDQVFFLPAWEAIYQQDGERYETWEQAQEISGILKKYYEQLGYNPIIVPFDTPVERVRFIEQHL